jgi:hypothetical protein
VNVAVTRYRQEWRNTSTHDHTLLFSEQDAILAIVSVSAFAVVLLNQVIETLNFKKKKAAVEAQRAEFSAELAKYRDLDFERGLVTLVQAFAATLQTDDSALHVATEAEILGQLAGFLAALDPSLRISLAMQIGNREFDLVVERGSERAAIELKRTGTTQFLRAAANQVGAMIANANIPFAVLFVPPRGAADLVRVTRVHAIRHGVRVFVVAPRDLDET